MKSYIIICLLVYLFLLLHKSQCQPTASDSCIEWNTTNSICTKCLPGLYLQFFFCIPCNPMCVCSSNTNFCQACLNITIGQLQYSSYRVGDICVLCNQTIPLCLQCVTNNNSNIGIICTKCMKGTYVTQQGKCSNQTQTCTPNCQVCYNITHCQLCIPNYYLDQKQNKCQIQCTHNCTLCHNETTCKVCKDGFYLYQGLCEYCIQDCIVCLNNHTCQSCIPGYLFYNGSCQNTGSSNCIEYTGGFENPTCLVCEPGYYNLQSSCNQCSGCLLCTQSFLCQTQCLEGFNKFNFACLQSQIILSVFSFVFFLVIAVFTI